MGPGTFSTPLHEPDAVLRCTQHDFVPMSLHSSQNLNSGHLAPVLRGPPRVGVAGAAEVCGYVTSGSNLTTPSTHRVKT